MHLTLPRLQLLTAAVRVAVALVAVAAIGGCAQGRAPDAPATDAAPAAGVQSAGAEPAGDDESASGAGTLTCEVYCSETRLRTANARISWIGPGMFQGASASSASPAADQLQTTVYKNGYDKDLYASFSTLGSGQGLSAASAGALPEPEMRAYDLSILRVAEPTAAPGELSASSEEPAARTSVEVEGLEPGMRYTWRIVFGSGGDQESSETVTCEAPVCPADIQEVTP